MNNKYICFEVIFSLCSKCCTVRRRVVGKSCVFLASAKALNLATIIQTASIYPFYFSELYKLLREIYKGIFLALLKQSKKW